MRPPSIDTMDIYIYFPALTLLIVQIHEIANKIENYIFHKLLHFFSFWKQKYGIRMLFLFSDAHQTVFEVVVRFSQIGLVLVWSKG